MITEKDAIRLHIGCGPIRLDGFVNIDARETPATDLVADAWDLSRFADASVSFIYCRHMIEHLTLAQARQSLVEWRRVLKPGGMANIVCPDLIFAARQLLNMKRSTFPDQQAHAMAAFYGWSLDERGGHDYDSHRWGYTFESLTALCGAAGFTRIVRQLEGKDSAPWHLNVLVGT